MPEMTSPTITGPAGALQVRVEQRRDTPAFIAVVCHPHPLYGGTMDNKVVTTLVRMARDAGALAVRFNFRGVGDSDGQFDDGRGETDDLLAVLQWCREQYPDLPVWLAGFSFGSWVAANAAVRLTGLSGAPEALLLVAPPVHHYPFAGLDGAGCPVTVIQGMDDEVVPADEVLQWCQDTPLRPSVVRLQGCSHFFHGRLVDLRQAAEPTLP